MQLFSRLGETLADWLVTCAVRWREEEAIPFTSQAGTLALCMSLSLWLFELLLERYNNPRSKTPRTPAKDNDYTHYSNNNIKICKSFFRMLFFLIK